MNDVCFTSQDYTQHFKTGRWNKHLAHSLYQTFLKINYVNNLKIQNSYEHFFF